MDEHGEYSVPSLAAGKVDLAIEWAAAEEWNLGLDDIQTNEHGLLVIGNGRDTCNRSTAPLVDDKPIRVRPAETTRDDSYSEHGSAIGKPGFK